MGIFLKKNKEKITYLVVFIFLVFLCSLFPYTGDDWAWGSSIGIERLESGFKDYNGRYVGNLIVLLLTRSALLRTIVMGSTLFGIAYLIYKITDKKQFSLFLLAILLILAIPRLIFRQAIVWTSGFTNYVIPTALILLYFYIISKDDTIKKTKALLNTGLVVLGFITALFVEHVTIYIIAITILMMIYQGIKEKRISSKYIFYLIGAVIGAILMFSNGAYANIANDADTYRNMPTNSITSVLEKVSENFSIVYKELVLNNTLLNIVLGLFLLTIVYKFLKNKTIKLSFIKKSILNCSIFVVVGYLLYMLIKVVNPTWNIVLRYTSIFEFVISVIFFLSIAIISLICIDKKEVRQKIIFYWLSIGILTIPLFVVQPIGSRCFFPSYCIFVLIALELYNYCVKERNVMFDKIFVFAIIVYAVYLVSIYGYIFKINQERIDYLLTENSKGEKVIEVVNLPYEEYLWTSRPESGSIWEERMKLFYNISSDVQIKNITLKQWNKMN